MYTVHLIGNAHLDPAWLWQWQEGYAEVMATFRSALDRMKEFDDFVFFAVVRLIDIVKPWPARSLQAIPGGRGIVIDDFVANLYSLAINWTIFRVLW